MSNTENTVDTHVFYTFLKFQTSILADEKDKKIFLDFALKSQWGNNISLMAFVVLDNEIHFLLQGAGEALTERSAWIMLQRSEEFLNYEHTAAPDPVGAERGCRKITEEKDILKTCRYIHRLPLEQGYVRRVRDYWWSSFQTYRGNYRWPGVDILPLLLCFSDDMEKSRILFLRYHRQNPKRF